MTRKQVISVPCKYCAGQEQADAECEACDGVGSYQVTIYTPAMIEPVDPWKEVGT